MGLDESSVGLFSGQRSEDFHCRQQIRNAAIVQEIFTNQIVCTDIGTSFDAAYPRASSEC
jgi:hypothetical protein